MALVVPFQARDPSTSTHEQDVSDYGCLTSNRKKTEMKNEKKLSK